jgi:aspartate/methionine/tyrosine aminotransferase
MLDEIGVAVTPGIDFDPVRGNRFLRFSFAGSESTVAEACRRLTAWNGGR